MHGKACPDMGSNPSNIVKFCKKGSEIALNPGLSQFEIVKAIYNSGMLSKFDLSGATKLVLIALAHHFNPNKKDMFPSQRFLAKQLGISERTAERAVAELKNAGLITYETQKVNHYQFTAKFFTSANLTDTTRQNVGHHPRQNVGQTNKHEQKKNTFQTSFNSNMPKGIDYPTLEAPKYVRDEKTPENDLLTAQKYFQELSPMAQNPLIKMKLAKIVEIWGENNLLQPNP